MLNGSIYELANDPAVKALLEKYRPDEETINAAKKFRPLLTQDEMDRLKVRGRSIAAMKRKRNRKKKSMHDINKILAKKFMAIYRAIREESKKSGMTIKMARIKARDPYVCTIRDRLVWIAQRKTGFASVTLGLFFHRTHGAILNSVQNHKRRMQQGA